MEEFPARLQALLTVALILDAEEAVKLFDYLPHSEREDMLLRTRSYLALSEDARRNALSARLKALRSEFLLRQITDVHPSHVALVLANEPASIIRVILHHLPQDLADEIVKLLPESAVVRLAACPKPPALPLDLLEVVKQAFIRQFVFVLPGDNPLTWLNSSRLRVLLREFSLQIFALAMRKLQKEELLHSLRRFPRSHSKEIIRKIKMMREVTAEQVLTAEKAVVWLTAQNLRNFSVVEDTGLMVLAAGLIDAPDTLCKFVTQKLSIEEAGRFHDIHARLKQADQEVLRLLRQVMQSVVRTVLQTPSRLSGRSDAGLVTREANSTLVK
ncbi:MAG: hypothetical protein RMM17_04300 [Acidobacteriota bacterium]|nr:hypothetical protein [Blastocatellia bacterium]MDW8411883.1 hypothetical protein [Acidobacteriota bacterium]